MSLALAVFNNSQQLAEAHIQYKKNLAMVGSFASSVISSNIPTLNNNPPHLNDFTAAFTQAKTDALKWVNGVMARLTDAPEEVVSYSKIISAILNDAEHQASVLINDPSNPVAQEELSNDLAALQQQIGLVVDFVSGAAESASNFSNVLPDIATQLQAVAADASQAAGADQAQIDTLNAAIKRFREDITDLIGRITELSVAEATEITFGSIVTAEAWPEGALIWLVLGPIIALEAAYISLDAIQIKVDQEKIAAELTQIKGLVADVATLHILASNFSDLASQTTQVESALKQVLQQWQALQNDVQGAVSDINDAMRQANAESFHSILSDVQMASAEWQGAVARAGTLALKANVSDAKLQVGMAAADVQAAMAGGKTMTLVEFANQPVS